MMMSEEQTKQETQEQETQEQETQAKGQEANTQQAENTQEQPTIDFSKFGDDANKVKEIYTNPDSVYDLLTKKRNANSEAKELRTKLDALNSQDQSSDTKIAELETRLEAIEKEKQQLAEKTKVLQKRENLSKLGISTQFAEHAEKLIGEIPETEEEKNGLIEQYKSQYPQWFGSATVNRVDGTGAMTIKSTGLEALRAELQEANNAGNAREVIRLNRLIQEKDRK